MRTHLFIWMIILGLAGGYTALAEKKVTPPKGPISIKGCQEKKPPVTFKHDVHVTKNKIECTTCHHKGAGTKCTSDKCHASNGGKAEGKRPGCKEMSPTKNPFHIRCVGCHKEKGKGPTKCAECHKE